MAVYRMGFYEFRESEAEGVAVYSVIAHTIGLQDVVYQSPIDSFDMRGVRPVPHEVVLHEGGDLAAAQAFYDDCWSKVDNKPPEPRT
ncbi:hypothetical protein ACWIGM_08725 [Bosea sp. NPDC055332]